MDNTINDILSQNEVTISHSGKTFGWIERSLELI